MRQILLALALVSASVISTALPFNVASARSIDRTPVVATLSGAKFDIRTIALLLDGRLQVVDVDGNVNAVTLSKTLTKELIGTARQLANAEIEKTTVPVVCAAMPPKELANLEIGGWDEEKDEWSKPLHKVLSSQHCAFGERTRPKHEYNVQAAQEFRAQLEALALNTLN